MRESSTLELKERVNRSFLKTVSAYANYGTGRIAFGVTDDGTEVGLDDLEDACLSIENMINDSVSPVPTYTIERNPSSHIIVLTVQQGLHKPYLYHAKAYKRSDTSTVEVDHLELTRLILDGKNLSYEETPASSQALSFSYLEKVMETSLGIKSANEDVLRTLELMDPSGSFNVAGELLADTNGFPGIDIIRFGESINILLDRERLGGTCIISQYDSAIYMYRKYYRYEEIVGSRRVMRETVPESAFRETIANALVHRVWDERTSSIRVAMHPDQIEVSSPGGLPNGLTEEEYLEGRISKLRNPIVGNIFFRLGIIERFGTGVARIRDAYAQSARKPRFEVSENAVTVVLPVIESSPSLDNDKTIVLRTLRGRSLPISEISRLAGFGRTKTQKLLKELAEMGYVQVVGNGRGTRYQAEC